MNADREERVIRRARGGDRTNKTVARRPHESPLGYIIEIAYDAMLLEQERAAAKAGARTVRRVRRCRDVNAARSGGN